MNSWQIKLGAAALAGNGIAARDGDVLVVAQKIVSKAEGRYRRARRGRRPRREPATLAAELDKDPRLVEIILSESKRVVRQAPGRADRRAPPRLRHGECRGRPFQVAPGDGRERCCCCRSIPTPRRRALRERWLDAFRRAARGHHQRQLRPAWRRGTVGIALGAAGLPALIDMARPARPLRPRAAVTEIGFADEIAAAASLVMGQADERIPAVLVRGLDWARARSRRARALMRPAGARSVPMTRETRCSRSPAASAAPSWRSASTACCRRAHSPSSPTPATISSISASHLARSRHVDVHPRRPRQSRDRLGPARRDLELHGGAREARRRDLVSARRQGSRDPCRAHAPARAAAKACRRSPTISAAGSASARGCCR